MSQIYFVRHAKIETGLGINHNEDLSAAGVKQLPLLGKFFEDKNVETVFHSPLKRALQTAKTVAGPNASLVEDVRLRERQWGPSAKTWDEVHSKLSEMDIVTRYAFQPEGGESWQEFEERTSAFWQQKINLSKNTAIVAHEGTLRVLLPYVLRHQLGGFENSLRWSVQQNFALGSVSLLDTVTMDFSKEIFVPGDSNER